MYGVKRHPIKRHRIQDGKAIVSITLLQGNLSDQGSKCLEWVGDGYQLLHELQTAIKELEDKHAKKKNL